MKKRITLIKSLLVAVGLTMGVSAWGQTTWTFIDNTTVWTADGVTLNGGNQYDENAKAVATGGVTFTGTSGFVSTAKGIGFNATGSTSDENISIVVPAGFKATVSVYTSGNRTVVGDLGGETQTFNANWASSTKEFNNAEGASDVTLYLYCNQNPGGDAQNKAPFLEKIILTDMSSVKSFPWTANAVATISGSKTIIKTYNSAADVDEGSKYTIIVNKAIKYGEDYYVLNDAQFDADVFGKEFTMGSSAPTHEFTYEKIDNFAFFGEVEDIFTDGAAATKASDNNVLSNGGGYSAMTSGTGYVTLTFNVPADGVYNLFIGMNNTNNKDRGFNYSIDGADVSETITVKAGKAYVQGINYQSLTAGDHTLTLNMTYSLTPIFDYLLITNCSSVEAVIADASGFATYVAPAALDFFGIEGLTAYTATCDGSKVTLAPVDDVQAGTAVVLKGAAKSYDVPVIASSETAKGDLKASVTAIAYNAEATSDYYYLALNSESKAQFTKLTSGSIAAGKAYLEIAKGEGARNLAIVIAGETTGIKAIETAKAANGIFNINGQRIAAPQKGLYIVNGKKVVIK